MCDTDVDFAKSLFPPTCQLIALRFLRFLFITMRESSGGGGSSSRNSSGGGNRNSSGGGGRGGKERRQASARGQGWCGVDARELNRARYERRERLLR